GLRQLRDQHEGGIIVLEQLMYLDACLGRRDEVEQLSTELHALRGSDKWTYPRADWSLAGAYVLMGDADSAIPWLEKALHQNYAGALTPAMLRFDPIYDPLRGDPRFETLCQEQMKLTDPSKPRLRSIGAALVSTGYQTRVPSNPKPDRQGSKNVSRKFSTEGD